MNRIDRFEGDYRFLSNFHWHDEWTVEHHFQAAKTDDPEWAARILAAETPGQAKKLGRAAPMRPSWPQERVVVMRVLLRKKFDSPEMAEMLVATGDAVLVEGNNWGDRFWGVDGHGENLLGLLLMETRTLVRRAMEAP